MTLVHWLLMMMLAAVLSACGGKPAAESGGEHTDEAGHAEDGHEGERGHEGEGEHAEQGGHADEGPEQTVIPADRAAAAGIKVAAVGAGEIADEHEVQGLLTPVDGAVAKVMARFPGPIRALRANVGDEVRAGQTLATIESNLSLSNYTVPAPISGVVLSRDASVGQVAGEGRALYEIANLSELWVDLHVFGSDAQHLRVGSPVTVTRMSDGETARTEIERILPGTATASQSTVARARIRNRDGLWRPGTAVKAEVTVDRAPVAVMVPTTALQTMDGQDAVFVKQGDTYLARPVKIGRRSAGSVEIIEGLKPGENVVVEQSFLIKADIEKSAAGHAH
jgi:cobalt-zinc-cadmium efflux system membrane fusion protein